MLDFKANLLDQAPDLSVYPNLESLDMSFNNLTDLTSVLSHPTLGTQPSHYILLDHNRLTDCAQVAQLQSRVDTSGAQLVVDIQGNFSSQYDQLPEWEQDPEKLRIWVQAITEGSFTYSLSCR